MDEIVADGCERMLENTEIFNKLARRDKSLAEKVADYVKGMLNRLYEGITKQHYESKVAQKYIAELQELWDTALEDALTGEESVTETSESVTDTAKTANKKTTNDGKAYFSLAESFTDSNGTRFDNAVLLDTDFFDGISPRKWGERLRTEVNKRASTNPFILPIADENGNTILLQFARPGDRVTKDGLTNHKVLDKLSSSTDNISKLAVIHIDEIVSVSEENSPYYTNENNHQWLDENGWLHRNANVINQKNGNIYNLTVDIAKTADGRTILYATDGKIKKVGSVQVNSLKIKGSGQDSNLGGSLTQSKTSVNRQYSSSNSNRNEKSIEDAVRSEQGNQKRFSMADTVEETDKLIAVHNKSLSGLKRMLQRNGVPFPSIAIKKAGSGHEGF